jgi:hypothetical protein
MKIISFALGLFFAFDLLACPYCAGSGQAGKDANTTLILALFIIAIYIPYFLIYRLIKKHSALKEAHDSTGSSNS